MAHQVETIDIFWNCGQKKIEIFYISPYFFNKRVDILFVRELKMMFGDTNGGNFPETYIIIHNAIWTNQKTKWLLCSLVTCTFNIWQNMLSCICQSKDHFKSFQSFCFIHLFNVSYKLCMVPQIFNLRPHLLKSIVHVIRFITNRKYGFYCIY